MDVLDALPPGRRAVVRAALSEAFGERPIEAMIPVYGGASGATLLAFDVDGSRYLLRAEGPPSPGLPRNPHRYACAHLAAQAGVGPAMHYVDAAAGVAISDFIVHRPLRDFPGGPSARAAALGDLARRTQRAQPFPELTSYPQLVARLLGDLDRSGLFPAGALAPHQERMAAIEAAYAGLPPRLAPAHNDCHWDNVLYDGQRLWLIDWESAYANDPLVDVAIMLDSFGASPTFEDELLRAWLGRAPDAQLRARLDLVRPMTRLYYAGFLLQAAGGGPHADVEPPPTRAFLRAVRRGDLVPGASKTFQVLGRIFLRGFLTGEPMRELLAARAIAP